MSPTVEGLQYSTPPLLVSIVEVVPTLVWWIGTAMFLSVQIFLMTLGLITVMARRVVGSSFNNLYSGTFNPWFELVRFLRSILAVPICTIFVFIMLYLEYIGHYGGTLYEVYLRRLFIFVTGMGSGIFYFFDIGRHTIFSSFLERRGWQT